MAKYYVPASYEYVGHIEVDAKSPKEAIRKATSLTRGEIREAIKSSCPTVSVFVSEEEEDVEIEEDDNV